MKEEALCCRQILEARIHFCQKYKGRKNKSKDMNVFVGTGFPWLSKGGMESRWHTDETNWSIYGPRLDSDNVRSYSRLQDRGAEQWPYWTRQHDVDDRDVITKIGYVESNVWKPRAQKAHEKQMCPNPTVRLRVRYETGSTIGTCQR